MPASFKGIEFHYQEDVFTAERIQNKQDIIGGDSGSQDNGHKNHRYQIRGFMAGDNAALQIHKLHNAQNGKPGELIFPDGSRVLANLKSLQRTRSINSGNIIHFEAEFTQHKIIKAPIVIETKRENAVIAGDIAKAETGKQMDKIADSLAKRASHIIDFVGAAVQDFLEKAETIKDFIDNPLQGKFGTILGNGLATASRFRQVFTPIQGWNATAINAIIDGFRLTPAGANAGRSATDNEVNSVLAIQQIIVQSQLQAIADAVTAPDIAIAGNVNEIAQMRINLLDGLRAQAQAETGVLADRLADHARALGVFFVDEVEKLTILENITMAGNQAIRPFCFNRYGDNWQGAMALINNANNFQQNGVLLAGQSYQIPANGFSQ